MKELDIRAYIKNNFTVVFHHDWRFVHSCELADTDVADIGDIADIVSQYDGIDRCQPSCRGESWFLTIYIGDSSSFEEYQLMYSVCV